jgi:hypothetical protein
MDYYFYKHILKYTLVLNELESFFTKRTMFIANNDILTQEFINSPNYITSSYCDHLLNERVSNESMGADPVFVTAGYFNENTQSCTTNCCNGLPQFVNNVHSSEEIPFKNYPIFVVENYNDNNIDDMLELDPNKNYYSNSYEDSYNENEKLYGFTDDYEEYWDSIYN